MALCRTGTVLAVFTFVTITCRPPIDEDDPDPKPGKVGDIPKEEWVKWKKNDEVSFQEWTAYTPNMTITKDEWENYKRHYNKSYPDPNEDARRFQIYKDTKIFNEKYNTKYKPKQYLNHSYMDDLEVDDISFPANSTEVDKELMAFTGDYGE